MPARSLRSTVAAHAEEWAAWNERLAKDEQLTIPDAPERMPKPPKRS